MSHFLPFFKYCLELNIIYYLKYENFNSTILIQLVSYTVSALRAFIKGFLYDLYYQYKILIRYLGFKNYFCDVFNSNNRR